jgi:hypothetical protein
VPVAKELLVKQLPNEPIEGKLTLKEQTPGKLSSTPIEAAISSKQEPLEVFNKIIENSVATIIKHRPEECSFKFLPQ